MKIKNKDDSINPRIVDLLENLHSIANHDEVVFQSNEEKTPIRMPESDDGMLMGAKLPPDITSKYYIKMPNNLSELFENIIFDFHQLDKKKNISDEYFYLSFRESVSVEKERKVYFYKHYIFIQKKHQKLFEYFEYASKNDYESLENHFLYEFSN
ncbi:MAG: hypothetical protein ACLFUH_01805 [Bacteroidales bacterium]